MKNSLHTVYQTNKTFFYFYKSIHIIPKPYYLFVCCPEKPFGFGCSLPPENDLDFTKE
jgi:hypothetical protein